ncbi:MAG: DUF1611 domain-containing protein [Actinobacteria bacterium HGW-Actinobacteria-4]|nr:MAG: DUF1611 domain-containing protein [Actinobacteria bacterium HGW-Actinobacteria-4]
MYAPVPHTPTVPATDLRPLATVFCEGNFAKIDGKTANGLVRHSERYSIASVIDSDHAGLDAGLVLDGTHNGVLIVKDLDGAAGDGLDQPTVFIFGIAPLSGLMSPAHRLVVLDAIARGMNIVNGLHEFLGDDPEMVTAALIAGVELHDIRRPHATKDLRMFDGAIATVDCVRIAVLGTDGAIGKRTTATLLTAALNDAGIDTVMVGTGQTGLMQGAKYGVALDAIPAQFGIGELEGAVVAAYQGALPQVIVIEGQGALSHPAYVSSTVILRGAQPQAVILQHAPARTELSDYPSMPMPTPRSEIRLIETFAKTRVIGLTINHENMTDADVTAAALLYEADLGLPATDPLTRPATELVDMVLAAFPALKPVVVELAS